MALLSERCFHCFPHHNRCDRYHDITSYFQIDLRTSFFYYFILFFESCQTVHLNVNPLFNVYKSNFIQFYMKKNNMKMSVRIKQEVWFLDHILMNRLSIKIEI